MIPLQLPTAALAAVALALGLTNPVSAGAQSCGTKATLTKLLNYSQLAERREVWTDDGSPTCVFGEPGQVATPDDLTAVGSTESDTEGLTARLQEALGNDRAFAQLQEVGGGNKALYVGCDVPLSPIDIAVEMRFFRWHDQGDLVGLDVVGRSSDANSQGWTPLEVKEGVVVLPGTDWPGTALANLIGEYCAFPAARFAVHALCNDAERSPEQREFPPLLPSGQATTLVGHSLGATIAQFITSTSATNLPACPGINAYAFSSLGLDPNYVDQNRARTSSLTSYMSECDWQANMGHFQEQVQPGQLYTLSESNSHLLNTVQTDLCNCCKGNPNNA